MKTTHFLNITNFLLISILLYSHNALANNISSLINQCSACHGEKGISVNNSWPNLAGQKTGYLIKELTAFRDGDRKNPLMSPVVKNLSNEDIETLAKYFSEQENKTMGEKQPDKAGHHVSAYCVSCHGMKGFTVNTLWPNLAGQKSDYLVKQLHAFKKDERKSPIMSVIAKELTDEQIKKVARYYSELPASK